MRVSIHNTRLRIDLLIMLTCIVLVHTRFTLFCRV